MPKIRLHLRYRGTEFSGWQKQPNPQLKTIQGELEKALKKLSGKKIATVGSGRTDAGVHARQQVAHFKWQGAADDLPWVRGLNAHLPQGIQVFEAFEAPKEFHALLSSESKSYVYYIHHAELSPLFRSEFSWHIRHPVSESRLSQACKSLIGEHDFRSFQNTGTDVDSTVRRVFSAKWERISPESLRFSISGKGFLKQMVRNIVGSQIEWEQKDRPAETIVKVLQAQDRSQAGVTAPAQGLFLNSVKYPRYLDFRCRKL